MSVQLEDLVARLRLDTSGVGTGLSGLNSSLSSVGDKASAAGKKMTLGITTPLVGIGIASTNLAASFDKTMRQVAIATGGPSEALSKLAKTMGAETAFSAGEAADAMLELAKGGMTSAQIEGGALAATMKLASAGGVGLGDASTYVANQLQTFGLKAEKADSVVVALAGAANASSASVESLGQGLAQGALAARNAGLSLQETTGVLSLFDAAGLKGSDAGTSLKSMLNSLIPTTDKAKAAMKAANLDFVDAEGNFDNVATVAEKLKKGLGPLSEAQRAQSLETIFGSDGMRAATVLLNGGSEAVKKYTKASKDQETTSKLANAAMEGTAGAMERAKGSIETAGLTIGQVLAPFVEQAAAKVEELANRFTELSPETQGMIVKGLALAAVVGPLTLSVGVLAGSLSKVIGVASSVTGGIGKLTGSLAEGETRMSRFGGAAKTAAGVGGMVALTYGLQDAAREGTSLTNVLSGAAGGAGIGAMFGPIGALVGAGVGGGLTALAGSFHDTAEEASAARVELLKTTGFKNAKTDAASLREALIGVVNAYGKIPRAAIEASFTGDDGKIDADVAKLRELGVSMDTIVSATLGRADAQRVVDAAIEKSLAPLERQGAAAQAAYDKANEAYILAKASAADYTDAEGRAGSSVAETTKELDKQKTALVAAKEKLDEIKAAQDVFNERTKRNTDSIRAHQRQVGELAGQLGLTREQYLKLPKAVRTDVEADGLPETVRDSLKLIEQYKGLQTFRNIRAVIEATDAPLTIGQIETLKKRYDLTPKQVKTLIEAVGVESEAGKVRGYKGDLDKIPPKVTTEVHTQYTYSGLKSPTRGKPDDPGDATRGRIALTPDKGRDAGEDYGNAFGDGVALALSGKASAVAKAGEKVTDAAKEAAEKRKGQLERVGKILGDGFADGIVGGRAVVVRKFEGLTTALEAVGNKSALSLAGAAGKVLRGLGKEYDTLQASLRGAREGLEQLEAARVAVEARQAALGAVGGDIGSLAFGNDDNGIALPPTAERIIAALTTVNDAAASFDTNLQKLRDAGLSQDALDQLIAKGPEAAAATALAILEGGQAAITQINTLQAQIATSGLSIQAKSSQTMYDVGVAAQQGLIAGLESQMTLLEEKMTGIAKAMVKAIKRALKIKSPSRVMEGLGEFSGVGFAQGLEGTTRAVQAASTDLSRAALVSVPTYADPNVASLAAARAARGVAPAQVVPQVRVFIGDRELTDIVRVELSDTFAAGRTQIRQGVL